MYIGIIGHSTGDKVMLSKLIGKTLQWMIETRKKTGELDKTPGFEYRLSYYEWYKNLAEGKSIGDMDNVYFASFSHPLKAIVSMFTSIPFEYFNDPDKKNTYIININNLDYKPLEGEKLIDPEKLFKMRNKKLSTEYSDKQELDDAWMTLNNYVIYFGYYICRNYIGKDIWTKVERMSNNRFANAKSKGFRIYTDIRNMSEYDYIRENDGFIIRVIQGSTENPEALSIVNDVKLETAPQDASIIWNGMRDVYEAIYNICYIILMNNS